MEDFAKEKFRIINNDCLLELSKIQDNSIDHTITSPPYNMNLRINKGKYISRQIGKEFSTKYYGFHDNLKIDDYFEFHKNTLYELLRVTKKYVFYIIQLVTGNKRPLFKLIGEFGDYIKEIVIWNKGFGQPTMTSGVMNSSFEFIIILTKDKNNSISRQFKDANFNRGTFSNVLNVKKDKSIVKNHSTTFPMELIDNLIVNFTYKDEVILDPFSGTRTTGCSALKNDRKYIGIELIKEYCKISIKRLEIYSKPNNISDSILLN